MNSKIKYILISLFLIVSGYAQAQQNRITTGNKHKVEVKAVTSDSIKAMLDEYEKVELPSLSVFLASAEEHPSLQIYKAKVQGARADKDLINRKWYDFVKFNGSYQYGYNNVLYNYYGEDAPVIFDKNASAQHHYSIGATVSFSLGDILNHKYEQRKSQAALDQLQYEYQVSLEERKLVILEAYNSVLEQLATIKVKAEAAALYNAQMAISETDFANGELSITSLSLERSRRSSAISSYQQARVTLHNAITLLEMLTNVTIIRK